MKKFITILSVMAALAAAFTSCEKEAIVGTADGDGLYLNKTEITLIKGTAEALVATVTPKDAATLSWVSADAAVATVDGEGVVTAVGAGETVVSATAGGMKVECLVKVQSPVTSVSLDKTEIYINKGESAEVAATVGPDDINVDFKYNWISSDETIFTVTADATDPSKAVVHGNMGGFGTLYLQTGDVTASIPVTINVELEGIVITGTPTGKIYAGDSFQLGVAKNPLDAIVDLSPVWSSSDDSILAVDQNGVVTAMGPGTATITVASNGFTATWEATVKVLNTVSFLPNSATVSVDSNLTFSTTAYYFVSSYFYVDSGDTLTFSLPEGYTMTQVVIQSYANNSYKVYGSPDSGTYDEGTQIWTGEANQLVFTLSQYTYITKLIVTYKD